MNNKNEARENFLGELLDDFKKKTTFATELIGNPFVFLH